MICTVLTFGLWCRTGYGNVLLSFLSFECTYCLYLQDPEYEMFISSTTVAQVEASRIGTICCG